MEPKVTDDPTDDNLALSTKTDTEGVETNVSRGREKITKCRSLKSHTRVHYRNEDTPVSF